MLVGKDKNFSFDLLIMFEHARSRRWGQRTGYVYPVSTVNTPVAIPRGSRPGAISVAAIPSSAETDRRRAELASDASTTTAAADVATAALLERPSSGEYSFTFMLLLHFLDLNLHTV